MPMSNEALRRHKKTHDKSNSWWLNDAKGITLARVCPECCDQVKASYSDEVMGKAGRYEDVVEETIEPEDY